MKRLLVALLFCAAFSRSAYSQSDDTPAADAGGFSALRSSMDKKFWISAGGGIDGNLVTGAAPSGNVGGQTEIRLRYQLDRCGAVVDWHVQDQSYDDPATIHNSILGAGVACTVATFGHKRKFWRDTHILAVALLEYGKSEYHIYQINFMAPRTEASAGTTSALGTSLGGEFQFPLLFGFWANAGLGLEWLPFKYTVPSKYVDYVTDKSTLNLILRVGLSFAF